MKTDNPKICVVGSSNIDLVVKSQRLPSQGETILGGEFLMVPGGKGANQAVAAARFRPLTVPPELPAMAAAIPRKVSTLFV